MNYFVTGTDTDCGKTFVTALLVRAARAVGRDAVGAKPFCCGPRNDVEILSAAAGGIEAMDELNPIWLKTPAAPRACAILGEEVADFPAAAATMRALASRHDLLLCEGAGGWLVPLGVGCTVADLAVDLGWPVIVVARNKLGAINHALLTVESVQARGLPLAGVVLNSADGCEDVATRTNKQVLEECLGTSLLAEVPRGAMEMSWPAGLAV